MSQVDNLLDNLPEEELEAYTADPISEEHIVIDSERFITVPDSLQRIAVQFDHNVETVTFDCPRYWDGVDMLDKTIYINYMRPNGTTGMYLASEDENGTRLVTPDQTNDKIMHFNWTISNYVTEFNGSLKFLVCITEVNETGTETFHWNTELNSQMRISEGLEVKDKVIETTNDIITQLLLRMGRFEDNASVAVEEIEKLKNDATNEINSSVEEASERIEELLTDIDNARGCFIFSVEDGVGTDSIQQINAISAGDNSSAFGESKATFKEGSETEYEMLVTVTKGYDGNKSTSEEIVLITEVYNDNGSVSGGNASDLLPEEQPTEAQFYRDGTQILSNYSIDFATTGSHGEYTHVEGYHSLATGIAAHAEGYDTYAAGNYSHTEGADTIAFGENSHAEGLKNTSNAQASHTEGIRNTADGKGSHVEGLKNHTSTNALFSHVEGSRNNVRSSNSHAEGINNILVGSASHAHVEGECNWVEATNAHAEGSNNTIHNAGASAHVEGDGNIVSGAYAHAEGQSGVAKGESSHVEGSHQKVYNEDGSLAYDVTVNLNSITEQVIGINPSTTGAIGKAAHAEGFRTVSEGKYAHAEGHKSYAKGSYSHAEGQTNYAEGTAAHAEGYVTRASGEAAHAEGYKTLASGKYSHAEGSQTNATYQYSHAEGRHTKASNEASHAEGGSTTASGRYSHAEGYDTTASGGGSHAEGSLTNASGDDSHAEGCENTASGSCSHVEGFENAARGDYSHAEGNRTTASGDSSHAEGSATEANGMYSHAEGCGTVASRENQHVQGRYNIEDTTENGYAHIVGNGTADAPSNAHTVDWNGNAWYQGKLRVGGGSYEDGADVLTEEDLDTTIVRKSTLPSLGVNYLRPQDTYNLAKIISSDRQDYFNSSGIFSVTTARDTQYEYIPIILCDLGWTFAVTVDITCDDDVVLHNGSMITFKGSVQRAYIPVSTIAADGVKFISLGISKSDAYTAVLQVIIPSGITTNPFKKLTITMSPVIRPE